MKLLTLGGGMKIPHWVCETHLREIDDMETSGEFSEAREVLQYGKREWRNWCVECAAH